jgi:hypothetical protein
VDLHSRQLIVGPHHYLLVVGGQQPPPLPVAVAAMRADRLHHHREEHVAGLFVPAVADHTRHLGRCHVAADRLAVHLRQPLDRTEPFPGQPQPEHLTYLEHTHLPERHDRPSRSR